MSERTTVTYMAELHGESPMSELIELHSGIRMGHMIQAIAELGVADHLAAGPLPVDELAERTGSDADALYRVLRATASKGLFTEVSHRVFALTALAQYLRSDMPYSLRDAFRMFGQKFMRDAFSEIGHTIRTGQPAFEHVHGTSLFEYVAEHPELRDLLGRSMGRAAKQIQLAAVETYDLTAVRTMVALDGGDGQVLAEVLVRHPRLRAVYVSQPRMVPNAERVLRAAGVADRVELVAGDHREPVPQGGEVYLISHVLHQLPDAEAVLLLKNVRQAMSPASRVLAVNAVIPEGDVPHPTKTLDSTMLALGRNRDRTEAEFDELLRQADLRLADVVGRALPSSVVVAHPA